MRCFVSRDLLSRTLARSPPASALLPARGLIRSWCACCRANHVRDASSRKHDRDTTSSVPVRGTVVEAVEVSSHLIWAARYVVSPAQAMSISRRRFQVGCATAIGASLRPRGFRDPLIIMATLCILDTGGSLFHCGPR